MASTTTGRRIDGAKKTQNRIGFGADLSWGWLEKEVGFLVEMGWWMDARD